MSTKTDNTPAVVPAATLATNAGALIATDDDWQDVSDGDSSPPTAQSIPLLHLNRKSDGGFLDTDTGEVTQRIDFVWLAKGTSRAYWDKPFGQGDKAPTCRSTDGVRPDPNSPDVQAETCAGCPNSRWDGDNPPTCKLSIEAMVFVPSGEGVGHLARVRWGGMAVAPAQAYWDSFSARMPRRPAIAFLSSAELEPEKTPNGTFLVPKFSRSLELSRADAQPLIDERDRRLAEWKTTVAEDVATGATREESPSAPAGGSPEGTYLLDDGSEPF